MTCVWAGAGLSLQMDWVVWLLVDTPMSLDSISPRQEVTDLGHMLMNGVLLLLVSSLSLFFRWLHPLRTQHHLWTSSPSQRDMGSKLPNNHWGGIHPAGERCEHAGAILTRENTCMCGIILSILLLQAANVDAKNPYQFRANKPQLAWWSPRKEPSSNLYQKIVCSEAKCRRHKGRTCTKNKVTKVKRPLYNSEGNGTFHSISSEVNSNWNYTLLEGSPKEINPAMWAKDYTENKKQSSSNLLHQVGQDSFIEFKESNHDVIELGHNYIYDERYVQRRVHYQTAWLPSNSTGSQEPSQLWGHPCSPIFRLGSS